MSTALEIARAFEAAWQGGKAPFDALVEPQSNPELEEQRRS
jgi:hypothetical protein